MIKKDFPSLVFFGTPSFSAEFLEALLKNEYKICAVVTKPDKPVGRHRIITPSPVKKFALKHRFPVLAPNKLDEEFINRLLKIATPSIGLIVSYAKLIPPKIISLFESGILNVHFSLLPKYAGLSPVQTAILNNEKETGVTIIKINEEFDKGEIVAQAKLSIEKNETAPTLTKKLTGKGISLLLETLPLYLLNKIKLTPQDPKIVEKYYTKKLTREDGFVPLENLSGQKTERMVRAFEPWPGVWTMADGKRVKILKAHLKGRKTVIDLFQFEGKKPISYTSCKSLTV